MRVIIKEDASMVSEWAAEYVAFRINEFHPTAKKPFVLGLPTGSTPLGMYAHLIKMCQKGRVSFENVITFNMDEYIGLAPSHPQSYHYFMWQNFFKDIDIKPQNVHILNGLTKNYAKECADYERAIAAVGGVHLFIGGVGEDGHIAFNEPFSSLSSRTRIKTLTESTIKANARFFDGDISQVPTQALKHSIEGSISHMWTLSALQQHPHGIIVCDKSATGALEQATTAYFMEVEKQKF